MEAIHILIYGLAIWRISSLFVNEDGPYEIFLRFREWSGITYFTDGGLEISPSVPDDSLLAQALSCIWCCSVWVSFFFTILRLITPELSLKIAIIFAFSAVAILIDLIVKKLRG